MRSCKRWIVSGLVILASAGIIVAAGGRAMPAQDRDEPATREYLAANGLLNRGHYDLAAEEYERFLKEHASHPKAPFAKYGLAVAYVRLGRHEDAVGALETLQHLRDFEFAAEAQLLLGQSHLTLGQYADAGPPLERVLRDHATHDLADDAAALLIEALYRSEDFDKVGVPGALMAKKWPQSPLRARAELFGGLAEMARDHAGEAAAHFEVILDLDPDGEFAAQASLLLARSHQALGDLDAATRQYRDVLDRGDDALAPDALYSLGGILRREKNPREAGKLLDRLLAEAPDHELAPLAHLERGRTWFDLDKFERAIDEFQVAHDAQPDLGDRTSYWISKSELHLERYGDAAGRLQEAIEAYPKSSLLAEMFYDRAIALLRLNHEEDAIDALRDFRTKFPKHDMAAEALHLMASVSHQLNEYEISAQYSAQFRSQYPDHELKAEIAFLAAENAFLSGDYRHAAGLYRDFITTWPEDAQTRNAVYRLGMAHDRLGEPQEAVKFLSRIVDGADTAPHYRSALRSLGDIHFDQSNWTEAEARYEEYLSFGPGMPGADDALLKLGLARHREKNYDDAIEAYDTLLDGFADSPHRLQAQFEKGQALVQLDRLEDAKAALTSVLEDGADSRFAPYALNHLAAIAMQNESYEEAAEYYQRLAAADVEDHLEAEALFQRGQALMATEQYADAAETFGTLVSKHPASDRAPLARANRALSLARLDRPEETAAAIVEAEREAGDALPHDLAATLAYEKVWAFRALDDLDAAKSSYRSFLEINVEPGSRAEELQRYALLELAELEATAKKHDEAIALLQPIASDADALQSMPGEFQERVLYRLGASEYEREQFAEAASAFEDLLARQPEGDLAASASLLAGESRFRLKEFEQAAEHLGAVTQEGVDDSLRGPALLRLGESLAALQQWAKSEEAFRTHLQDFGDSTVWFQSRFGLGFALENQAEYDKAIEEYQKVVDHHQGATAARAQFQIGESLFAQKRYSDAVRELLKVDILYAYPEWSAAALYEAGRCFETMAQIGEARRYFEQVREHHPDTPWATLAEQRISALANPNLPGRGDR